LLELLIF